jgi:acyl-CoA dehydrogenase
VSDVVEMLRESVGVLLDRHSHSESLAESERDGWAAGLWSELERAGMTSVGVPEKRGGSGGDLEDAVVVIRAAANYAAAVPLAETALLAGWLLADAGIDLPRGPLTAAVLRDGGAVGVPYARHAVAIAVLARSGNGWGVGLLEPNDYVLSASANLAREPRDKLTVRHPPALRSTDIDAGQFRARGALARSIQIAGALDRVLSLAIRYAQEREQFGSPLSRFQAVQHLLTVIAEETSAAGAAVDGAVARPTEWNIAVAKIRSGEAAGIAAAAAHQVHGAIGFTDEHALHHSTRRLWSWRDEFGTEASWAVRLGKLASGLGADRIWALVTDDGVV